MKQLYFFLSLPFLISACGSTASEFPNITSEQIFTDLKWGVDYSSANKILTETYKLKYLEEQQQLPPLKVFVYSGGNYNNIETKAWTVTFYNDSLIYVQLRISEESPAARERLYNTIIELNDRDFTQETDSTITANQFNDEKRWYCEKEGKRISNILLSKSKLQESNEIAILMAKAY